MASITVEAATYESVLSVSTNEIEVASVGIQGASGPNTVTTATTTDITGLLKGAAGQIAQAIADTDYSTYSSSDFSTDFAAADLADLATKNYADLDGLPSLYDSTDFDADFAAASYYDISDPPWQRITDGSRTGIKPANDDDQLVIGPLTDFDAYGNIADAQFLFVTNTETTFGGIAGHGPPTFIDGGGILALMRSQGTSASPTAVTAGMGIGAIVPLGHDGTGYTTNADGITLPGIYFEALDVATGDIGQLWEIMGGAGGSSPGVIRLNTQNKIGFYRATPAAQSTGWSAGTYSALKSFDPDTATYHETARVVATMMDALITVGLLGA